MASLLILTGSEKGQRLSLSGDRITLGRDPKCGIAITESMVRSESLPGDPNSISRKHALISCAGEKYYIEDGDGQGKPSRNGVFVNDKQVPFRGRVQLCHNDCIKICSLICAFQDEDSTFFVEESISHQSSLLSQPVEKLRIILEISNSLSRSLEIDSLLPQIVDHLFQLFPQADRGFVLLRDEVSGEPIPHVCKSRRSDPHSDARFSACVVRQCLETVEAILGNDLPEQFPDSDSVAAMPIRSLMCAPLWTREGQPLGAIQLDSLDPKKKFTRDDLDLLLGVASQASIALSIAQFHRETLNYQRRLRDLALARQVQASLLPHDLPKLPGYSFFAHYEPALEVGGDYYDFIPLPNNRLAILLGDVAGKGVAAALVMVKFSVEARVCLLSEPDPAAAVSKLNRLMSQGTLTERFVTLIAMVLDPTKHTATIVNAGHPSPLLFRNATGTVEQAAPPKVAGRPIGTDASNQYGSCQIDLELGDRLLLFSDGITDAMDKYGRLFGKERIRPISAQGQSARETGEILVEAVKQHASGCNQNDDMTLVCFERTRD